MSDFNPLDRAKIRTHRSSFDMTQKTLFSAKIGQLVCPYFQIAIPNDSFKISSDWFTRTIPVNTAAYTRLKEYYDFFAVPLRLISRALPQAFTQMTDYMTSAAGPDSNTAALSNVPYVPLKAFSDMIESLYTSGEKDDAGFPLYIGMIRMLNMFGYGAVLDPAAPHLEQIVKAYSASYPTETTLNPLVYRDNINVNILPLLAYQKVYYDFFSNSQWEKHLAYSYNVDYWQGTGPLTLSKEMCSLRYANYPKDWIFGVLPNSQYGDVAMISGSGSGVPSGNLLKDGIIISGNTWFSAKDGTTPMPETPVDWQIARDSYLADHQGNPVSKLGTSSDHELQFTTNTSTYEINRQVNPDYIAQLGSSISALQIRAVDYLQRWKEVVQFSSKDYADQIEAQFGIKAPEYMGNHSHYIGGWTNVININEVVNNNLDPANSQASIAGKGVGSQSGHTLTYDVGAEHCVIICVYHCVPLTDWALSGVSPQLLHTSVEDFPQPAFDQLGMQPVPLTAIVNDGTLPQSAGFVNIGYNLRYWDFKSSIDRVCTGFDPRATLRSWAAPLTSSDLLYRSTTTSTSFTGFNYRSMKVRPQQLDPIFAAQQDGSVDTDQLLCNINFSVYKVSSLDRNGLPF